RNAVCCLPFKKLPAQPSADDPPEPRQRVVLLGSIVLWYQDCEPPLAFLFATDKADDAINGEGIAPLIQALNNDIAITGFHGRNPASTGTTPTRYAARKFCA